jgi:hypothetical protein
LVIAALKQKKLLFRIAAFDSNIIELVC